MTQSMIQRRTTQKVGRKETRTTTYIDFEKKVKQWRQLSEPTKRGEKMNAKIEQKIEQIPRWINEMPRWSKELIAIMSLFATSAFVIHQLTGSWIEVIYKNSTEISGIFAAAFGIVAFIIVIILDDSDTGKTSMTLLIATVALVIVVIIAFFGINAFINVCHENIRLSSSVLTGILSTPFPAILYQWRFGLALPWNGKIAKGIQ